MHFVPYFFLFHLNEWHSTLCSSWLDLNLSNKLYTIRLLLNKNAYISLTCDMIRMCNIISVRAA